MGWERLFLRGGVILKTTDTVNILARAWFTLKHCSPAWMMGLGPGCPRVFPPSEQGPPLLHICSFPVSLGSFLGMKCIPVAGLTSQLTTKYGCGFDLTPPPPRAPRNSAPYKGPGPKGHGLQLALPPDHCPWAFSSTPCQIAGGWQSSPGPVQQSLANPILFHLSHITPWKSHLGAWFMNLK